MEALMATIIFVVAISTWIVMRKRKSGRSLFDDWFDKRFKDRR